MDMRAFFAIALAAATVLGETGSGSGNPSAARPGAAAAAYAEIWNAFHGKGGMKRLFTASPALRPDGRPALAIDEQREAVSVPVRLDVDDAAYEAWKRAAHARLDAVGPMCRPCGFTDPAARVIGGRAYRFDQEEEAAIQRWEAAGKGRKAAVVVRLELFGAKKRPFGKWDVPLADFGRPGYADFPLPVKGLNRLRDLPPSVWNWIGPDAAATGAIESATALVPLTGLSLFRAKALAEIRCTLLDEEDFKAEIDEKAPPVLAGLQDTMVPVPGRNFAIGRYEVTQDLWTAVMGSNPSASKGARLPVDNVSWRECQDFLQRLNASPHARLYGHVYRLPTEEEWEYACRAGAEGDFCRLADGSEVTAATLPGVAWFNANSERRTHPVGEKAPNAFGLHDMHGNVWEWTSDREDVFYVTRGGSWQGGAERCEASNRNCFDPDHRNATIGLRLALTIH